MNSSSFEESIKLFTFQSKSVADIWISNQVSYASWDNSPFPHLHHVYEQLVDLFNEVKRTSYETCPIYTFATFAQFPVKQRDLFIHYTSISRYFGVSNRNLIELKVPLKEVLLLDSMQAHLLDYLTPEYVWEMSKVKSITSNDPIAIQGTLMRVKREWVKAIYDLSVEKVSKVKINGIEVEATEETFDEKFNVVIAESALKITPLFTSPGCLYEETTEYFLSRGFPRGVSLT